MGTEKRIHSDLAIPPGEYLAEVLDARRMSQAELARRTGRPVQAINEIIKGEKALTPETALQLERALGVPGHIWTGLESRYQLVRAKNEEEKLIRKELPYLHKTPYKRLMELGCVARTRDSVHKVRELHRFYGISSLGNLRKTRTYESAFRARGAGKESGFALAAWLRCGEARAEEVRTEAFEKTKLRAALNEIKSDAARGTQRASLTDARQRLAACGVALVSAPGFPGVSADAAVFWLRVDKAVLLMREEGTGAAVFQDRLVQGLSCLLLHKKTTFIERRA
jgi:HTH-type transcriptional regulator/antitoxin HigA